MFLLDKTIFSMNLGNFLKNKLATKPESSVNFS